MYHGIMYYRQRSLYKGYTEGEVGGHSCFDDSDYDWEIANGEMDESIT